MSGLDKRLPERLRAKWKPVRVMQTYQNKKLEAGSDSIRTGKALAASSVASLLLFSLSGPAHSQTTAPSANTPTALPDVNVAAPKRAEAPHKPRKRVATTTAGNHRTSPTQSTTTSQQRPQQTPEQVVAGTNNQLDDARRAMLAPTGAGSYEMSQQFLESLPQSTNTTLDRALLQAPGVSQDTAASGDLPVRNEHANLQYRINGIMLPDGVGAFGQII